MSRGEQKAFLMHTARWARVFLNHGGTASRKLSVWEAEKPSRTRGPHRRPPRLLLHCPQCLAPAAEQEGDWPVRDRVLPEEPPCRQEPGEAAQALPGAWATQELPG